MVELLPRVPVAEMQPKKIPFMVEVEVHPEGQPFLVSGTKTLLWVGSSKTGVLRAAVRSDEQPDPLTIISEVAHRGAEDQWENSFPYTAVGVGKAISYVRSYGISELDLLVPSDYAFPPPKKKSVNLVPTSWMPSGRVVVVPSDRSYLGTIRTLGEKHWILLVHNPSRGMAVSGSW